MRGEKAASNKPDPDFFLSLFPLPALVSVRGAGEKKFKIVSLQGHDWIVQRVPPGFGAMVFGFCFEGLAPRRVFVLCRFFFGRERGSEGAGRAVKNGETKSGQWRRRRKVLKDAVRLIWSTEKRSSSCREPAQSHTKRQRHGG